MSDGFEVRPARAEDARAMAWVHVQGWRETYRGLLPDELLDDPGFLPRRERFWTTALTGERWTTHRFAVAESGGSVIGIAGSAPAEEEEWDVHLNMLYLLSEHHGGGAGTALLQAVVEPHESAALWVADPNPRAQAFYRKHGFVPDGVSKVEDGVRDLRMVRAAAS
ncbi:GNAT family N-acetyltransferase [Microbacterium betulae]|uniref:GNAT family N-acetyltransferase n=1 Tax=Microbacterium betulae TaxID=2981139 RepID=A0AA97FDH2_9MICO|nr:GNAT family N-acetyltransferase [Microbacterium sp. AB]WOF21486.1 GNAT family N-acetyltransferase [Microbacterium sp. AB]